MEQQNKAYEFLTPEEIDNYIKGRLAMHPNKGGKKPCSRNYQIWDETSILIRRSVIWDLLGQGLARVRIQEEIMARWGISYKTAWTYINDAYDALRQNDEEMREYTRGVMLHRLESLAEDALANRDRKSALSAYEQINKINGLYTTKVEADVKGDIDISFDFGN